MNKTDLKAKLVELWGSTIKPINVDAQLRLSRHINFGSLDDEALVFLLDILLKSSGSSGSGFSVDFDNYDILDFIRGRMYQVRSISRRLLPILRCYDIFYGRNTGANEGQWSLAVMYLISALESYFRSNNPYTDSEGVVVQALPQTLNIRKNVGSRINQIGEILKIYRYQNGTDFARYLQSYDTEIITYINSLINGQDLHNVIDGVKIPAQYVHLNIIERISTTRNSVMHGNRQAGQDMFLYLTLYSIMFLYDESMYSN
jgi:hypothetical protein